MAAQTHLWKLTPAGSAEPVPLEVLLLNVPQVQPPKYRVLFCASFHS